MKMCLVMILVKKVFIFSKTMIICLLCPLLCGLFFFWKGAKGELSYKVKKNPVCRILRLRRVALATFFHSAAVRSLAERFLCHRTKFPMTQKSRHISSLCRPFSFSLYPVKIPEDFPPDGPRMPRSTRSHTDRPLPGLPICLLIPSLPRKLLQRMVYTVNKIPTSWLLPEAS